MQEKAPLTTKPVDVLITVRVILIDILISLIARLRIVAG
jgi:hypothetical protein